MLNRVILIGRLTRDPELRYTPSGTPVAKFSLAIDRPFLDKQGNRGTDFIDVVAWRKLGELCARYLGKGRLAAVEGRLEIRAYDDNQGIRRKVAEVVADNVRFLDGAKGPGGQEAQGPGEESSFRDEIDFSDDDEPLPF
ncbi:MAG: single-stranded DNA-binding protein [Candidatus Desulforudis sp.]|nr:single-stranded DNA-binding protein [Desulforudis sp.]